MRTLRRRIEALEKCMPPAPEANGVIGRSLRHLSDAELDGLTNLVKVKEANPDYEPTETEMAAERAYSFAYELEIRRTAFGRPIIPNTGEDELARL